MYELNIRTALYCQYMYTEQNSLPGGAQLGEVQIDENNKLGLWFSKHPKFLSQLIFKQKWQPEEVEANFRMLKFLEF